MTESPEELAAVEEANRRYRRSCEEDTYRSRQVIPGSCLDKISAMRNAVSHFSREWDKFRFRMPKSITYNSGGAQGPASNKNAIPSGYVVPLYRAVLMNLIAYF